MGVCIPCDTRITNNLTFQEDAVLYIKEKDRLGKVIRSEKVKFKLPAPLLHEYEEITLSGLELKVSTCILTGMDPRSVIYKDCQDGLFFSYRNDVFITALFDGHGIDGLKIVEYSKNYIKNSAIILQSTNFLIET